MPPAGYERLLGLYNNTGNATSLSPNDPDRDAVRLLHELLRCHGFLDSVPGPKGNKYGTFGPNTSKAIIKLKMDYNSDLPKTPLVINAIVDHPTIIMMINWTEHMSAPSAVRLYLQLVLKRKYTIWDKMVFLISTHEESSSTGGFSAQSSRSQSWDEKKRGDKKGDRAGLSFGIMQFTHQTYDKDTGIQAQGRLYKLVNACRLADKNTFDKVFKIPTPVPADLDGFLEHLKDPAKHLTAFGFDKISSYDLYSPFWSHCFKNLGLIEQFQQVQVNQAVDGLKLSYRLMKVTNGGYAPLLKTERGIGFWLDITNQIGDLGAKKLYNSIVMTLTMELRRPPTETEIMDHQIKKSDYKDRRIYYRNTDYLTDTDDPFTNEL
jgi:hypothetical protein